MGRTVRVLMKKSTPMALTNGIAITLLKADEHYPVTALNAKILVKDMKVAEYASEEPSGDSGEDQGDAGEEFTAPPPGAEGVDEEEKMEKGASENKDAAGKKDENKDENKDGKIKKFFKGKEKK